MSLKRPCHFPEKSVPLISERITSGQARLDLRKTDKKGIISKKLQHLFGIDYVPPMPKASSKPRLAAFAAKPKKFFSTTLPHNFLLPAIVKPRGSGVGMPGELLHHPPAERPASVGP